MRNGYLRDRRALWIEAQKRRQLIDHLLGEKFSPEVIREIDQMNDLDLYDCFGHHGYHAGARRGLLFRTNESAFVNTKRKLVDECDLWAILSLPGGVFSAASAGVKTNLAFFTNGKKTERIWYYDLSHVKVGKKTPLTLAHFGFGKDGGELPNEALPATLTADWCEDEANAGNPFPTYARMLAKRGKPEGDSRYSWSIDFATRRAKARADMQPRRTTPARSRPR